MQSCGLCLLQVFHCHRVFYKSTGLTVAAKSDPDKSELITCLRDGLPVNGALVF